MEKKQRDGTFTETRISSEEIAKRVRRGETVSTAPVFHPNRAERRQMAKDARRLRAGAR